MFQHFATSVGSRVIFFNLTRDKRKIELTKYTFLAFYEHCKYCSALSRMKNEKREKHSFPFPWKGVFRGSVAKDDEAAKRTLMVSLCRNERPIIILGSLYAVLIKIARVARYFFPRALYTLYRDLFRAFASDSRRNVRRVTLNYIEPRWRTIQR